MHLELMAKLLDTERQFKKKNRRVGIYKSLEEYFDTIPILQRDQLRIPIYNGIYDKQLWKVM
jgi:hypothetical protein